MRKTVLLLVSLLLLTLSPAHAQDQATDHGAETEHIFLQMLRRIPMTLDNRSNLIFVDRSAIEMAYPDVEIPPTFADFDASDTQWQAWFNSIRNSFMPTAQYMMQMDTMSQAIGIDYFDIDQELSYGTAPNTALILKGEFDQEAVEEAFSNRDYQQVGDMLWCRAGDCSTGQNVDLASRDMANPFGGHLGRNQPVVIDENWIASSPTPRQLNYSQSGDDLQTTSLGESLDIIDAVNAIAPLGTVLQASLWDGMKIGSADNFPEILSNPNIDFASLGIDESLGEIGFYTLALVADITTEDEQIGLVAFTFSTPESAEASLQEMVNRLETLPSLMTSVPFTEVLEQRNATIQTDIIQGETYAVGLLMLSTPKVTFEQLSEGINPDEVTAPSTLYSWLNHSIINRDNIWMAFDSLILTD